MPACRDIKIISRSSVTGKETIETKKVIQEIKYPKSGDVIKTESL